MLDENNIVTYEVRPEWYSVQAARTTHRALSLAIARGDARLCTAVFHTSNYSDIEIEIIEP
jgi:hypothetical protein